jgi:hypothetical protein
MFVSPGLYTNLADAIRRFSPTADQFDRGSGPGNAKESIDQGLVGSISRESL